MADGLWLSANTTWRWFCTNLVQEVLGSANASSKSVQVDPGFSFEVTTFWLAGRTVNKLFRLEDEEDHCWDHLSLIQEIGRGAATAVLRPG